jgi:signal transduction histidine kinase
MGFIGIISSFVEGKVKKFGAQYRTFAILTLINHPLAILYELYSKESTLVLGFRVLSVLLCFALLFRYKCPRKFQKYIPIYWYLTILIGVPLITTILLLQHRFSIEYLINFNIGVMVVLLLVDWISFLIIQMLGILLGVLVFYGAGNVVQHFPNDENLYLFCYMFLCIFILNSILTRNKEIYIDYMQRAKDELNLNLEQKVSERTKELKKALAVKTEFLNNISHEVRTPVQGFTAISRGLVEHWDELQEKKRIELAEEVARNAERLGSLVVNLLDLSKFTTEEHILLQLQQVDLCDLVKNIIDECKTLYMKEKLLKIKFDGPNRAIVIADRERLGQVLRNIFLNAMKFSPNGGEIKAVLKKGLFDKDKAWIIAIQDEGIGIPKDELTQIFEAFVQSSRTNNKAGGKGLGLSISKKIIEAHHGKIWAQNNEKKGATFYFLIPARK